MPPSGGGSFCQRVELLFFFKRIFIQIPLSLEGIFENPIVQHGVSEGQIGGQRGFSDSPNELCGSGENPRSKTCILYMFLEKRTGGISERREKGVKISLLKFITKF